MPTPEVIALADEVHAHLERGNLTGLGTVDVGTDGTWLDAEIAARIVLADVDHRSEQDSKDRVAIAHWEDLAQQLRYFLRAIGLQLAEYGTHVSHLTDQMPGMLWSTDHELNVTSASGACLHSVGRRPVRRLSLSLADFFGADDLEFPPLAAHQRALRGDLAACDYRWHGRLCRIHVAPLRGPDGSIIGTVGTALDVTAHSQTDAATHEGDERFRLALQGSPVIVYRQDTDLRHTWIYNPQHGLSPDAVIGKTDAELLRREDAAIQAVIKRKVLATGVGAREQVRVTVGGEVAYYDLTIEPLRDATDKIIGVTGAATNITALKRAEEELGLRESQLAEAQRLAQLGSWELDLATNQFSWSDEHYRIFGVEPQPGPLSPAMVQATIHPEDYDRAMAIFESSIQTGEPYETELRIIRPDGEVRVIHSRGTMLQEASGRPQRMVGTAQDITERKRAEEERTLQRERQARLDGMLFAVRELAARMNDDLTESSGDIALLRPQQSLAPELQNAIDRLAARVSGMMEDIVELQRLILAPAIPSVADVDSAQLVSKRE